MNSSNARYITVDIGGTVLKYGIMTDRFILEEKKEIPTHAHLGGTYIQNQVISIVEGILLRCASDALQRVAGVAISTAGMVNPTTGEIFHAGPQIPNYAGINLRKTVEEHFGLPCQVDNDVKCAAVAEMYNGSGEEASSALMLTIGTGIGACFASREQDGRINLFRGHSYSAFEVGYMHQKESTFQELASTTALVRRVQEKTGEEELTGREIFRRSQSGDRCCLKALKEQVEELSTGIANLCYVINPQMVILGGGIMEQEEFFRPHVLESLQKKMIPVVFQHTELRFAKHKNNAGMIGALVQLLDRLR